MDISDAHPLRQSERIKSRISNNNGKRANNKESESEEVDGNKEYNVDVHISEDNVDDVVCSKQDGNNSASDEEELEVKPIKKKTFLSGASFASSVCNPIMVAQSSFKC